MKSTFKREEEIRKSGTNKMSSGKRYRSGNIPDRVSVIIRSQIVYVRVVPIFQVVRLRVLNTGSTLVIPVQKPLPTGRTTGRRILET